MISKEVANSNGETLTERTQSILKELDKETGTTETWKAKRRMVISGNFELANQAFGESTSTHNVDI
eukprot:8549942-Prorocentrum_lima.AAC.1